MTGGTVYIRVGILTLYPRVCLVTTRQVGICTPGPDTLSRAGLTPKLDWALSRKWDILQFSLGKERKEEYGLQESATLEIN